MSPLPAFASYDGHFVTDYLAVGACPGRSDGGASGDLPAVHAAEIAEAGIRGIVHVASYARRIGVAYVHHLPEHVQWLQVGFWDGYLNPGPSVLSPLTPAFARMLVQRGAMMLRDHSPVLVHCMGGVGRSGNVAALLLAAREQIEIDDAIARVQAARPCCSAFNRASFWRDVDVDELLELARTVLDEPVTDDETFAERVRGDLSVEANQQMIRRA